MRASLTLCVFVTLLGSILASNAQPAYTAEDLIKLFKTDRGVCFDGDPRPECNPVDLQIGFEFDSDRLTPQAKENLDQVAAALTAPELRGKTFKIDGYTDATGGDQYNQTLSERRARAVADYLVVHKVAAASLRAQGFGKSKPKVLDDPYSAENRRVEGSVAR